MDGFRPDAIVIDAPRSYHVHKVIVFLGVEGLLIATGVLAYSEPVPHLRVYAPSNTTCCVLRGCILPQVAVPYHRCQPAQQHQPSPVATRILACRWRRQHTAGTTDREV